MEQWHNVRPLQLRLSRIDTFTAHANDKLGAEKVTNYPIAKMVHHQVNSSRIRTSHRVDN